MDDYPGPFNLSEKEFLEGEDGRLDVDDIFAKTLSHVLDDFKAYTPEDIVPDNKEEGQPSLFEPGYRIVDVPAGILMLAPDGSIAGAYASCDLVLDEAHRGKGLGMELVIERCLRDGQNPVHNLDESAYSHAGLKCHRAAWNHVRNNPREARTRLSRWNGINQC